jgi:hypothetical protein
MYAGQGTGANQFALTEGVLQHTGTQPDTVDFVDFSTDSQTLQVASGLMDILTQKSSGDTQHSETYFSGQSGLHGDGGQVLVTQVDGRVRTIVSENGMGGITVFGHDDGGQPVALNDTSDSSATGLSDPAALASAVLGGQTYVFASSGNEIGLP